MLILKMRLQMSKKLSPSLPRNERTPSGSKKIRWYLPFYVVQYRYIGLTCVESPKPMSDDNILVMLRRAAKNKLQKGTADHTTS